MADKKPRSDIVPKLQIPENILLPDGRTYKTSDLLDQCGRSQMYNLRSRTPTRPITRNRPGNSKYKLEDWHFIRDNSIGDICNRYIITDSYAKILKNKCQDMIRKWPTIIK